jgi:DNA-binding NarL/FixJ family response regulator
VKKMSNDGMTVTEIAEKLGLNESTVRSYKAIIDKAEENRKLKEG